MFKYKVIKNAVSYELANFCLNYFLLKRDAVEFMYKNNIHAESSLLGTWKDKQIPNTYSHYADFVMETLLVKMLPVMKEHTGLDLIPTYSYARAYKKGDILKRHKDRPSCEISTTLNLGGDKWSIFIDPTGSDNVIDEYKNIHKPNATKGEEVVLEVGDMLVYSGCELEHWREPFEGNICGQVFLHYNHLNGKFADSNKFDNRPMLGLPSFLKR
nr:putative ferrochelatase [uncultured Mediterranean phage uvMED]